MEDSREAMLEQGRTALMGGFGAEGVRKPVIVKSEGARVWDDQGNSFIDLTSQSWTNNIGGSDPRIAEAAYQQALQLSHVRSMYQTEPQLMLAAQLAEIAPEGLGKVAFSLHGSTAIETAMRLALKNSDTPGPFIALNDAYHGRTFATMGLSWPHGERRFDQQIPWAIRVRQPYAYRAPKGVSPSEWAEKCAEDLREVIRASHTQRPVAFIMEPVQGNGTQLDFPVEYYQRVREICSETGVFLIFDEIQTGFGRTGKMWASEYYGVTPDILVFGKAAAGGYPLAGIIAREDMKPFGPGEDALTFGGFPPSMAAALENLRILREGDYIENAARMGEYTTGRLKELAERHPLIGEVRGPGLLIGVELVEDRETKAPAISATGQVLERGWERGVMFGETRFANSGNVVKFKPPMCVTKDEIDTCVDVFDEILTELEAERVNA